MHGRRQYWCGDWESVVGMNAWHECVCSTRCFVWISNLELSRHHLFFMRSSASYPAGPHGRLA